MKISSVFFAFLLTFCFSVLANAQDDDAAFCRSLGLNFRTRVNDDEEENCNNSARDCNREPGATDQCRNCERSCCEAGVPAGARFCNSRQADRAPATQDQDDDAAFCQSLGLGFATRVNDEQEAACGFASQGCASTPNDDFQCRNCQGLCCGAGLADDARVCNDRATRR